MYTHLACDILCQNVSVHIYNVLFYCDIEIKIYYWIYNGVGVYLNELCRRVLMVLIIFVSPI